MKKIIALLIILSILLGVLASCGNTEDSSTIVSSENDSTTTMAPVIPKIEYEVLQTGASDSGVGGDHKIEVNLFNKVDKYNSKIRLKKKIEYKGQIITAKYSLTSSTYLYNTVIDEYIYNNEDTGETILYGYITGTDDLALYLWSGRNYKAEHEDEKELSQAECEAIARKYFSQYVSDAEEYRMLEVCKLDPYQGYGALYEIPFKRYAGDIPTLDFAKIRVTVYGDVVYHKFQCIGEIVNEDVLKNQDFEAMDAAVDAKIADIYATVADKYVYKKENVLNNLIRMSNGKYAMQYNVILLFERIDGAEPTGTGQRKEIVSLVVYLN